MLDEKQAIYGFRGSDVKVILGFISRSRNATLIGMTHNYRSNPLIIDCANAVVTAMNQRVPNSDRQLIPQSSLPPLASVFSEYENEKAEAYATIKAIQKDLRNGIPAKEIAVLYRSRNIKTAFEKALVQVDIPYMLLGERKI
ncbi:ATP-dependent helicase [Photobacterium leiognathi]|uniref:3'-5' exonuclease n=1 Tax=Photobacterium leiognathi TaxID=553611 RepID=UPI001EE07290|nr:3'-5' exonuclease [Photobacterium leiognathi]MCG3884907.1 ATP-dependent helicase [Photobacterium leiognathi]